MAVAYASVEDILASLPDSEYPSGTYGALIGRLINASSELVDSYTRRPIGAYKVQTDTVKLLSGNGKRELSIPELAFWPPQKVEVTPDGETWIEIPTNRMIPRPFGETPVWQIMNPDVWQVGDRNIRITGKWGYSLSPPEIVKQAVIIQTIRWLKRSQQAYQDVGAISDLGQQKYVQKLDPDISVILENCGLQRWVV